MDTLSQQLVDFTKRFSLADLPAESVTAAKHRIIDTLGCAVGGLAAPPAVVSRRVASRVEDGQAARIWGVGSPATPEDAAFANGVALRYLDYNDTYRAKDGLHPSDNIGALVAGAEALGLSGEKLLEGVVVAYEVHCRFADSIDLSSMGWDQSTSGVVAAALGVGRMMDLPAEQLANAVSLALVPNLAMHQTRIPPITWWKGCAAAMGGRQGLYAARLAAEGMVGPVEPFSGANGLYAQIRKEFDLAPPGGRAPVWGVQQTNIKRWPVRDSCQLPIETVQELGIQRDPGEIASIEVETYASCYRNAVADPGLWAPTTRETADHSLPFCVAVTLLDGDVTPETFSSERFQDNDVLGLLQRMSVVVNDAFTAATPGTRRCRVTVERKSQPPLVAQRSVSQADVEGGFDDRAIRDKFVRLAAPVLTRPQAEASLETLSRLEKLDDVGALVDHLVSEELAREEAG